MKLDRSQSLHLVDTLVHLDWQTYNPKLLCRPPGTVKIGRPLVMDYLCMASRVLRLLVGFRPLGSKEDLKSLNPISSLLIGGTHPSPTSL